MTLTDYGRGDAGGVVLPFLLLARGMTGHDWSVCYGRILRARAYARAIRR